MSELWELVWGKPEVDPDALSLAIERELDSANLDFRTRLLIREGTQALASFWGEKRWRQWLKDSPVGEKIAAIQNEVVDQQGFPHLKEQLMESTKPETVKQYLRDLGSNISRPLTLEVGGSIALILNGYLARATADIDIIDEVPEQIRSRASVLSELQRRYKLDLTHFQSHYLPHGWKHRLQHQGNFGRLDVYTADVYDIFLGKLYSKRTKDLDDLRAIAPRLDKQRLTSHLQATTSQFYREPELRKAAEKNWYIVFGEKLPAVE